VSILNNVPLLSLGQPLLTARLRGAHRVIWLQDVQSGLVAGVAGQGFAARAARWVEGFLLRRADTVIAISDELATTAQEFGVDPDRIHVIENWAPLDDVPQHPRDNVWASAHALSERPRFLYSGTLARKHTPEALVDLAKALPDCDVIVVSEGVGADWLRTQADELGLTNLLLFPFQPFNDLPQVLASADVLVALLTNDAAGHSVPSKILSYLCAGRPILASIPSGNAAARMIVERADAGAVVQPGARDSFVAAATELIVDSDRRERLGRNGRSFAEATFSSDRIAEQVLELTSSDDRTRSRRRPLARPTDMPGSS
jgi:glycosyltransferase involved in cell wall biosynthesis